MPLQPLVQSPAIWLIPFVQLKAVARQTWRARYGGAVMPQIMTLREWAQSSGVVAKRSDDLHFDPAIDRLTAQRLMQSVAKSTGQSTDPVFVDRLLDASYELAAKASAIVPSQRLAWIHAHARLFETPVFQFEAVIKFLALSWAGGSQYEVDVLWQKRDRLLEAAAHIYVSEGVQQDALQVALLAGYEFKTTVIDLGVVEDRANNLLTEVVAVDAEDTVQQTVDWIQAAQQTAKPQQNIALVALDRQITRRISAALHSRSIFVRDETGWALSTTTAAAQLLAWLTSMTREALSDDVLAAMKTVPSVFEAKVIEALEAQIRANGWVVFPPHLHAGIQTWQAHWAAPRSVVAWLNQTRELLLSTQLLTAFEADAAGRAVLAALHMTDDPAFNRLAVVDGAHTKMPLQAFIHWVRAVLEASRFKPRAEAEVGRDTPPQVTVTILPLPQLWGRTFDAIVLPGCDEGRLPARPLLTGDWRPSEREALQLVTADIAMTAYQKAWDWVCAQPRVTMIRHTSEGNGSLQQSLLLQRLQAQGRLIQAVIPAKVDSYGEPAASVNVFTQGVVIDWQQLAPTQLSASSYADLRACPYRFYATRILGLSASDELDGAVDKRDFGTWLHGTLHRFHEAFKRDPTQDRAEMVARLDRAAAAEQAALGLDAAAFLPFSLIWPETREAYLAWLMDHVAQGYHYHQGEIWKSFTLELAGRQIELVGKIDRIDTVQGQGGGGLLLIDYKTESASKTKARLSKADEDTQLAFYAALVQGESGEEGKQGHNDLPLQAAYVNLAEKSGASDQTKRLPDLEARREALLDGIWSDLSNIASGHGLRALGEGAACDYCQARGLCRKDFQ